MVRAEPEDAPALSSPTAARARRIERKILQFVRERGVVGAGEGALVAVSGGPDSTAMLVALCRLREQVGFHMTVAQFDHMLRGREEAREDEAFVRRLCERLGVPVASGRGDVPARVRRAGGSVEDVARRMRYAFLGKQARVAGATVVLLGHTLNDRAETVLMHLIRGSGLDGLVGIAPRSPWPFGKGPDVGRPLLELAREETESYCREVGVEPRRDPTNELVVATRNRMRRELLPKLREFNPAVETALARLAENASRDVDFLDAAVAEVWDGIAVAGHRRVSLDRAGLTDLHPAVRARVLRRAAEHVLGAPADLEAVHVGALASLAGRGRGKLSLPRGLTAAMTGRALLIRSGATAAAVRIPETAILVPGTTVVAGWRIEAELTAPPRDPRQAGTFEAFLDASAISGTLVVRSRRPGDRLRPLGLGGEKKVQDVLVDGRVPAEQRDGVPIVCDGRGVLWVAGLRMDERAALTQEALRALRVRVSREH